MSHYDKFYEELAAEQRKALQARVESCYHERIVNLSMTNDGKMTMGNCSECGAGLARVGSGPFIDIREVE